MEKYWVSVSVTATLMLTARVIWFAKKIHNQTLYLVAEGLKQDVNVASVSNRPRTRRTIRRTNRRTIRRTNRRTIRRINRRTIRRTNRRTIRRTNRRTI